MIEKMTKVLENTGTAATSVFLYTLVVRSCNMYVRRYE